jgi:hypothetical protein
VGTRASSSEASLTMQIFVNQAAISKAPVPTSAAPAGISVPCAVKAQDPSCAEERLLQPQRGYRVQAGPNLQVPGRKNRSVPVFREPYANVQTRQGRYPIVKPDVECIRRYGALHYSSQGAWHNQKFRFSKKVMDHEQHCLYRRCRRYCFGNSFLSRFSLSRRRLKGSELGGAARFSVDTLNIFIHLTGYLMRTLCAIYERDYALHRGLDNRTDCCLFLFQGS